MWKWLTDLIKDDPMTTFSGGVPNVTFSNDDLYKLGQAIQGASAPGATAPPPAAGTVTVEIPWQGGRTIVSMQYQDIAVLHFKTPAGELPTAGNIAGAEYGAPPCQRYAVLSTKPADFSTGIAGKSGISVSFDFNVTTGPASPWVYPLKPDTDYYLNISNQNGVAGQNCTMFVDLNPPK